MKTKKDNVFSEPLSQIVDFKFDEKVANIFEDMLKRSIPGYASTISTIGLIADRFFQSGTNCYDLGSSLGAATLAIRRKIDGRNGKIIAVDNSKQMIARSKEYINADNSQTPVELICGDVRDITIKNASLIILNFTLQFISPNDRTALLQKIYDGLLPGGIVLISEKIKFENKAEDKLMIDLYYDFKRLNGYSELEISQKRDALENVMIVDTMKTHQARAKKCGFNNFYLWFRTFNFISYFLIK
jgi:tRNA (cmo5U34)-methyltransferase